MIEPQPIPRPKLHTNGDFDAWAEQFLFLAYVLRMSPLQIAQIDHGLDPDHPDAWAAGYWAHQIERDFFPLINVKGLLSCP